MGNPKQCLISAPAVETLKPNRYHTVARQCGFYGRCFSLYKSYPQLILAYYIGTWQNFPEIMEVLDVLKDLAGL